MKSNPAFQIAVTLQHLSPDKGVRRADLGSKSYATKAELEAAQKGILDALAAMSGTPEVPAKTLAGEQRAEVHLVVFAGDRIHSGGMVYWPQSAGKPDTYKAQVAALNGLLKAAGFSRD